MPNIFDNFLANPAPVMLDGVSEQIYHANRDFASKHSLDIFADCPAKFRLWQQGLLPDVETPALRFGSALHAYTLQRSTTFFDRFVAMPSNIKVRRGKEWEAFSSANAGKEILTADEMDKIQNIDMALGNHDKALALIYEADGKNEQTILFPKNDLPCKARLDRVLPNEGLIVDLKTCISASPEAMQRAIINYRYHVQGAFYIDAIKSATGEDYDFAIVAVEKEPPFAVAVYLLEDAWIEIGRKIYTENLQDLAEATRTDTWRGYEVEGDTLKCPDWYLRKFYA